MPYEYNPQRDRISQMIPAVGWTAGFHEDSDDSVYYLDLVCFALVDCDYDAESLKIDQQVIPMIANETNVECAGELPNFLALVGPDGNKELVNSMLELAMKERRRPK